MNHTLIGAWARGQVFLALSALSTAALFGCEDENFAGLSKWDLTSSCARELHSGDYIMRRGSGRVSDGIIFGLQEEVPITHGGFVVPVSLLASRGIQSDVPQDKWRDWAVIHAVSSSVSERDGMQVCSIREFVRHASDGNLHIARIKGLSAAQLVFLENRLLELLEDRVPFDHLFEPSDHSRIYCSELALMLLEEEMGVVSLQRNHRKPMAHSLGFEWAFDTLQFTSFAFQREMLPLEP